MKWYFDGLFGSKCAEVPNDPEAPVSVFAAMLSSAIRNFLNNEDINAPKGSGEFSQRAYKSGDYEYIWPVGEVPHAD